MRFPAGNYLSVSIRLRSNISLYLDQGATIVAAEPSKTFRYDPPEPNPWDAYQDFGHSHWHNSLIWGENLENISILGPGVIWGWMVRTNASTPGAISQPEKEGRISDVTHRNVCDCDVFEQAAVDAFQCESSGVVEDAVRNRNVFETAVGLSAKLYSSSGTVVAVSQRDDDCGPTQESAD